MLLIYLYVVDDRLHRGCVSSVCRKAAPSMKVENDFGH